MKSAGNLLKISGSLCLICAAVIWALGMMAGNFLSMLAILAPVIISGVIDIAVGCALKYDSVRLEKLCNDFYSNDAIKTSRQAKKDAEEKIDGLPASFFKMKSEDKHVYLTNLLHKGKITEEQFWDYVKKYE